MTNPSDAYCTCSDSHLELRACGGVDTLHARHTFGRNPGVLNRLSTLLPGAPPSLYVEGYSVLFYTSAEEPTVSAGQAVVTVDLCNTTVIEEKVASERSKLEGLEVKKNIDCCICKTLYTLSWNVRRLKPIQKGKFKSETSENNTRKLNYRSTNSQNDDNDFYSICVPGQL